MYPFISMITPIDILPKIMQVFGLEVLSIFAGVQVIDRFIGAFA